MLEGSGLHNNEAIEHKLVYWPCADGGSTTNGSDLLPSVYETQVEEKCEAATKNEWS